MCRLLSILFKFLFIYLGIILLFEVKNKNSQIHLYNLCVSYLIKNMCFIYLEKFAKTKTYIFSTIETLTVHALQFKDYVVSISFNPIIFIQLYNMQKILDVVFNSELKL